jgi:hypothetical protein
MGMLSFTVWQFAAAGAACAAAPVLIHLLNRRRYRVVEWAAMDFLREAIQKNRRVLQLRDILLLVLRTAAVLLIGLALARPYWAGASAVVDEHQPVNAVIVVDNSLSMAYEGLVGSLLDQAKERAREIIASLPEGSRTSIFGACDAASARRLEIYANTEQAYEALGRISLADRSLSLARAADDARRTLEGTDLRKRVIFVGDRQQLNWREAGEDVFRGLPEPEFVHVTASQPQNTWISDLRIEDGLTDVQTPAIVIVELRYSGLEAGRDVQVTLSIGDTVAAQKTISIDRGQGTREVDFEIIFDKPVEQPTADRPAFVPLRASITPDRLTADDERFLIVPVVAALPVVFIDQYGADEEDVALGRVGESHHLRRLLAPRTAQANAKGQLVKVRHIKPDQLTAQLLTNARLVVVAGVEAPTEEMVSLLRQHVEQGYPLFIAAGARFDPVAWNQAGWLEGNGILPAPLLTQPMGQTPEDNADDLAPFSLSFESLAGDSVFALPGVAEENLKQLYAEPLFFKAVRAEPVAESRILASYDLPGQPPFLCARRVGKGEVVFCSTGVLSSWNTLPKTNAIIVFDRLLRSLIEQTLPQRNLSGAIDWTVPLPENEQNLIVRLSRPLSQRLVETVDVGYIGREQRGVTFRGLTSRGVYRAIGLRPSLTADRSQIAEVPAWDFIFAVNGPSDESDLTPADKPDDNPGASSYASAGLSAKSVQSMARGQHSWRWLVLVVLVLLLGETVVLAWPAMNRHAPSFGARSDATAGSAI